MRHVLLMVVCLAMFARLAAPQAVDTPKPGEKKDPARSRPVRVYTNDDLDRVAPYRDQTGALSTPAVPPPDRDAPRNDHQRSEISRNEAYWRGQAERLRERTRSLERQIDEQHRQLERAQSRQAQRVYGRRGSQARGATPEEIEARLRALEREIREREAELAERARRAGALPGWIR